MGSSETNSNSYQTAHKESQEESSLSIALQNVEAISFKNDIFAFQNKEGGAKSSGETDDQAYNLSWKEFPSNLISFFRELQEEEEFVDVTLACEGRQISAHKIVLSASSPFFRKLLTSNPCQHPIIILNEVRYQELTPLLHYMYHGEVHIQYDQIREFLRTARLLQVRGLTGENHEMSEHSDEMEALPEKPEVKPEMRPSKETSLSPERIAVNPAIKRQRITSPNRSPSPPPRPEKSLIGEITRSSPATCIPITPLPPIPGLSIPLSMPSTIASLPQACVALPLGLTNTVHHSTPFPQFFSQNPSQQLPIGHSEDTSDTCASDRSDERQRPEGEEEDNENCLEKMSSLANMAALKGLAGFPGPSGLSSLAACGGMMGSTDHSSAVGRPRFDFYRVRATDPRPCHLCGKIYKNAHTLRTHMEDKHSNCNGFRCVLCGTVAKSRNSLHSHMSRQHRGISTKDLPLLAMPAPWNPEMASKYIQLVGGVGEVVRQNYRRSDRDISSGRDSSRDLLPDNALGSDASTPTSQENGALSPYPKPEIEKERERSRAFDNYSHQMEMAGYLVKPPTPSLLDTYLQMMRASGVDLMHNMNEKTWEEIRENTALGRGVLDLTRNNGSPHEDDYEDNRGSDHYSDDESPSLKTNERSKLAAISIKSPLRPEIEDESKWAVQS